MCALTARFSNMLSQINRYEQFEVVGSGSQTQLQVGGN